MSYQRNWIPEWQVEILIKKTLLLHEQCVALKQYIYACAKIMQIGQKNVNNIFCHTKSPKPTENFIFLSKSRFFPFIVQSLIEFIVSKENTDLH